MADVTEDQTPPATGAGENAQQTRQRRPRGSAIADAAVSPAAPAAAPARISFAALHDGRIDWERATPETREKLRRAFSDPLAMRELGLLPGDAGAGAMEVDPSLIGGLFDGLSALNRMLAKMAKFDPEVADMAFKFTPEQKASMMPGAAAVLNQYGGEVMGKHANACLLGTSLVMLLIEQVQFARELQARKTAAPLMAVPESHGSARLSRD